LLSRRKLSKHGRLAHQAANGRVRQEQCVEFLFDEFRPLAARERVAGGQMRLEFVDALFDRPAAAMSSQLATRRQEGSASGRPSRPYSMTRATVPWTR
jgi:hypothetical protein